MLVNEVVLAKASGKAERIIFTDFERALPSMTRSWIVMEKLSVFYVPTKIQINMES